MHFVITIYHMADSIDINIKPILVLVIIRVSYILIQYNGDIICLNI